MVLGERKEKIGYCKLKEDALDRTLCITRFGRGCGPVVRQTTGLMNFNLVSCEWDTKKYDFLKINNENVS
jgi:hypothetical protein